MNTHNHRQEKESRKTQCWFGSDCRRENCRFDHAKRKELAGMSMDHYLSTTEEEESSVESSPMSENEESEYSDESISLVSRPKKNKRSMISKYFWWDSGCSTSQTFDRSMFSEYEQYDVKKTTMVGDCGKLDVVGRGIVRVRSKSSGKTIKLFMEHVPSLGFTLVSNTGMDKKGVLFQGGDGMVQFLLDGKELMRAHLKPGIGLYALHIELDRRCSIPRTNLSHRSRHRALASMSNADKVKLTLLHRRLGHLNWRDLLYMCKNELVKGVDGLQDITYRQAKECLRKCKTCLATKPMRVVKKSERSKEVRRRKRREPQPMEEKESRTV